eukprot:TRINITY_DN469_c0_g1_i4.p1 TRINITY_DN469_c0_g1~~TRINITY_DN469_c0_g1_i4.p1  ORF type:complete len:227 (-),score=75.73 TRINITY_DN469_c0_g1_i4:140-820(-)
MMAVQQILLVTVGTLLLSVSAQFQLSKDFGFNELPGGSNLKPSTTPVPILNFMDRQNPDGSYTYGYENGDGSYKIETKHATGEVEGKYGYIDSNGDLREVEYGAAPDRGFRPKINGIAVVPPPAPQPIPAAPTPKTFVPVLRKEVFRSPTGQRIGVVKRRRPVKSAQTAFVAPFSPAAAPREEVRSSSGFIPFNSQELFALNPLLKFHPAQNINLNDGSYTVSYSG